MPTNKKPSKDEAGSLWEQNLVKPYTFEEFNEEIENTEKMIVFGESSAGKTAFALSVPGYLKSKGLKPDDFLMCILYPDRPTGLTKLLRTVPKEFRSRILVYPVNNYEELISSTAQAVKQLDLHKQKTGKHGWLVVELLEEAWKATQDYYTRKAYGESLGEYFAKKRAENKAMSEGDSAYQALSGWGDWAVIKYQHNYNWIDKLKRLPYNILFTAEMKKEDNKDSVFFDCGQRPAGEKDNIHRVDTVISLKHLKNEFIMQSFKLTGFSKLYGKVKITGKNGYSMHRKAVKSLEDQGFKSGVFAEMEKVAGITPPKPSKSKPVQDDEMEFEL